MSGQRMGRMMRENAVRGLGLSGEPLLGYVNLGKNDEGTLDCRNGLGGLLYRAGRYDEAKQSIARALEILGLRVRERGQSLWRQPLRTQTSRRLPSSPTSCQ